MDIYACERKAQAEGYNTAIFDLVGPAGHVKCKWLDAYYGMFIPEGQEGFIMSKQVPEGFYCENFNAKGVEE